MKFEDLKNELLKNPKIKKEFEKYDLAFEISEQIIDARVKNGLTQKDLAIKLKTKQSSIARAENGTRLPSISFLVKIAKVLNTSFKIEINSQTVSQPIVNINTDTSEVYKLEKIINFDELIYSDTNTKSHSNTLTNSYQNNTRRKIK